jgi:putative methanogenesis marker protein 17
MKALEYFEVECPEETGGKAYREIAEDIFRDLDLLKTIGRLHIYIDPKIPLFLAVGITKKLPRLVRVRDFAGVKEEGGKVTLDISEEKYLSQLLKILWNRYGRNLVEQPDRWTVIITGNDVNRSEIEEMVVFDPSESMHKDLIYALQYIAPEGFKVRRQFVSEERFYYVASEDTLPEDIIETLVAEKFARIGVTW